MIVDFLKFIFKRTHDIVLVDYDNRIAFCTTKEHPKPGTMFFFERDSRSHMLYVISFTKNGKVYNLRTENGLYLLFYK